MSIKGKSKGLIALYAFLLSVTAASFAVGSSKYGPSGSGGSGTVTSVTGNAPLSFTTGANPVGSIADGAIVGTKLANNTVTTTQLATTAVTPGSYTVTNLTVGADGRITAASNGSATTADSWDARVTAFVLTKCPTLTSVAFRSLANNYSTEIEASTSASTATATMVSSTVGRVMAISSGTTANAAQLIRNRDGDLSATPPTKRADIISSINGQNFAIIERVWLKSFSSTGTLNALDVSDETTASGQIVLGANGAISLTHWTLQVGNATAVDTGVAYSTTGFTSVTVISCSGTVSAWNIDAGTAIGSTQPSSGAGNVAGHWVSYAGCGATPAGTAATTWLDEVKVLVEPAT